MKKEMKDFLAMYGALTSSYNPLGGAFHELFEKAQGEPYPHDRLGDGYELRNIELKDKKGKPIENRSNYAHLYHNDLKVSDEVFRRGGTGGKFKDGYCQLIHYKRDKSREDGFSYGNHVIINHLGEICLGQNTQFGDYPSHMGGHVGCLKDLLYDLRTGKPFMVKSSTTINGESTIIVEHRYDWYGKDLNIPLGLYVIQKWDCSYEKFDNVKK